MALCKAEIISFGPVSNLWRVAQLLTVCDDVSVEEILCWRKACCFLPKFYSFFLSFGHHKGHFVILTDPKYSLLILWEAAMGTKIKDYSGVLFMAKDIRDVNGNNN